MDFTHDYAKILLKNRCILLASYGQKKDKWPEGVVASLYYSLNTLFIS